MGGPLDSVPRSSRYQLRKSARVVASVSCSVKSDENKSISVSFSEEGHACVSIFNGDMHSRNTHKGVYMLDWCYEEEKGVDEIYTKEVKPLRQGLFDGTNCCVISYGASTQLIQGSGENQSLAQIAMSDILDWSNKNKASIDISFYDVYQDQIYDLLQPNENGVLIYEDSQRQVQLKGLSKVSMKTLDDFKKYYLEGGMHIRGDRGLIVYIYHASTEGTDKCSVFSKINFLEFRGYGGAKSNKSLYSVMNIVHALNNKNPISYRETKLTRFLQDFLSPKSGCLVIACLEQSDNEENKRALILASQSSRASNRVQIHPSKKCTFVRTPSLHKRHDFTRAGTKTNTGHVHKCARKKPGLTTDSVKNNMSIHGEQLEQADTSNAIVPVMQELGQPEQTDTSSAIVPVMQELEESEATETNNAVKDICGPCESEECNGTEPEAIEFNTTSLDNSLVEGTSVRSKDPSPNLTEKLREISNSFKLLQTRAKPTHIATPRRVDFSSSVFEPKTPSVPEPSFNLQCFGTPHDSLKARTTGMKKSLVQECLTYLNSANKEELKRLKGIGEIRATRILQLREDSPEPFKEVKDLKDIGVTPKQFQKMALNFLEES